MDSEAAGKRFSSETLRREYFSGAAQGLNARPGKGADVLGK